MNLIAAVYEDWGIGRDGTQPVTLAADRAFFRRVTRGAMVIVGRRTLEDFPNRQPLPGRVNVALSRRAEELPGFRLCRTPEEAVALAQTVPQAFVIGGGSVYRALMPYCALAYITRLHCAVESDTFFPNLDMAPDWTLDSVLQSGEEQGIRYEMCLYRRAPELPPY